MNQPDLSCDALERVLADHLEGALDDSGAAAVEVHLAGCVRCRSLVQGLESIARDAAALPPLAPSRDLWPAIEARLETPVVALTPRASARSGSWQRVRLGAIAAGLVVVTAGITYRFAARGPDGTRVASVPSLVPDVSTPSSSTVPPVAGTTAPGREPALAAAPEGTAQTTTVARRARLDARTTYDTEITQLRGVLSQRSTHLDPSTVAVIENSLATIDRAIAESRAALARDPASRFLSGELNKALEKKLGILRTAALLPART